MIDGPGQRLRFGSGAAALEPVLPSPPRGAITFFYYDDLPAAVSFYRDVLGLRLVASHGFCAIFELAAGARLGLVDAVAGSQRPIAGSNKGAIISLEVDDVGGCLARLQRLNAAPAGAVLETGCGGLTEEFKSVDPGGYTVEFFRWLEQPACSEA